MNVFLFACHVSKGGVNLCHLFLEGNPRYLGRKRHHPFPKRYNSVSSNRSSFPQKLKVASRKEEFFDDQSKYLSCITARSTVSVPLQRGSGPLLQCAAPLRCRSGPLLQCAAPPRYRFGTAQALHYNARRRLGTASVPLGPSITMRGADTPFAFYKVLIRSE